jgi:hypothetical protein
MFLDIAAGTAEDIDHFGLIWQKMVCISLEFSLYLKLSALEYRVFAVCKQQWVWNLSWFEDPIRSSILF